MKKNIFLLGVILFVIVGCQQNEVIKTHGIAYLNKREKLIIVNKTNKNDAISILGQPATKGMVNDNLWIYIERTRTRGKLLKLGRNYLKKNNVLVLDFNKYGIVVSGVNEKAPDGLFYGYEPDMSHVTTRSLCSNDCAFIYSLKNNCIINVMIIIIIVALFL